MRPYKNGQRDHGLAVHSFAVHNEHFVGDSTSEHAGWEILFGDPRLSRGIEIGLRGGVYDLSKVPALIYNGHEPHHEMFHRADTRMQALVITESYIDEVFGSIGHAGNISFKEPSVESQDFLAFALSAYELLRPGHLSPEQVDRIAENLVLEIVDTLAHDQSAFKKTLNESLSRVLFKDILVQLHKNLSFAEFDLDHLSLELGVSKFHVIRTTKKLGGFTPHAYLMHLRLLKAKDLLLKSDLKINDILIQCGFEELSTFNKSFKKAFGLSPGVFRKSL